MSRRKSATPKERAGRRCVDGDRAAAEPGGCECPSCGCIFIGPDDGLDCAACAACAALAKAVTDKASELQRRLDEAFAKMRLASDVTNWDSWGLPIYRVAREAIAALRDLKAGQREPDERVREALKLFEESWHKGTAWERGRTLAAEVRRLRDLNQLAAASLDAAIAELARLRRLQAAQREPVAWMYEVDGVKSVNLHRRYGSDPVWKETPLYTQAQRDDHPTAGLLRSKDLRQVLTDVANGIDSPGLVQMAQSALRQLDRAALAKVRP